VEHLPDRQVAEEVDGEIVREEGPLWEMTQWSEFTRMVYHIHIRVADVHLKAMSPERHRRFVELINEMEVTLRG
jgi:hypothetical protein